MAASIYVSDEERRRLADAQGRQRMSQMMIAYQWLVMRQGVDTVKPDVHVRKFAQAALGRQLSGAHVVEVVTHDAQLLGIKAYELDWRIWAASRGGAASEARRESTDRPAFPLCSLDRVVRRGPSAG